MSPAGPILHAGAASRWRASLEPAMKHLRRIRRIDPDRAVGVVLVVILPWLPVLSWSS